jgi:DNA-binding NarL/FixJ family response regulator
MTTVCSLPAAWPTGALVLVLKYDRAGSIGGETRMKFLVVDDHVLIREALRGVLHELKPDTTVLEAVDSRQAARELTEHPDIDLVTLDLNLPDGSGFALLEEIRARHPSVGVVVMSAQQDRDSVTRALDLGALGFIPKSARRDVMIGAFNLVFSGGIYVPPEILARVPSPPLPVRPSSAALFALGLTERQMDVLLLMMGGKSNKHICRELDLAEATVKNHVTAILKALKVSNRTEAVIAATALGIGRAEPR